MNLENMFGKSKNNDIRVGVGFLLFAIVLAIVMFLHSLTVEQPKPTGESSESIMKKKY